MKHIILEKAKRYAIPVVDNALSEYKYDKKLGYWINRVTGDLLMLSNNGIVPNSKKCDIETGEDQKGE